MDALVTDVKSRPTVSGLRGLGRAGLSIVAVGSQASAPGLWSRYTKVRELAPDAGVDPAGFAARIGSLAAKYGPLVVYPGYETSIEALYDGHEALPGSSVLAMAPRSAVDPLRDKASLAAIARDAGLRSPGVLKEATAGELRASRLPVPCVIKPVRPNMALATARVVRDEAELHELLARIPANDPVMVQERVSGPLASVAVVMDRQGKLVARFQQVAVRTWPEDAGGSSVAVAVPPDDELVDGIVRMLASVKFWGLAHVQLIGNGTRQSIIDCNTRFYGSMPLALASGVNLPAAWHAVALDRPVHMAPSYRVGVTYRWLEGDLTAARRGLIGRLRPIRGRRVGAMWAWDDPLPGGLLAENALRARVVKRLR